MAESQKNPASGFLIMAAFNILGALVFLTLYFLNRSGESSFYFLLAAGAEVVASVGLWVMYNIFKRKLQR